jgi:hypothetical protein
MVLCPLERPEPLTALDEGRDSRGPGTGLGMKKTGRGVHKDGGSLWSRTQEHLRED